MGQSRFTVGQAKAAHLGLSLRIRRLPCWLPVLFTAWAIGHTSFAHAVVYRRVVADEADRSVFIALNGSIVAGDADGFFRFVRSLPSTDRIIGVILDSPGGRLLEAERIATAIQNAGLSVLVPNGAYCASACFLIYAAAEKKYFSRESYIGVHSVSDGNGAEDPLSMAVTTSFARTLAGYGVSPSIIGKLVTTKPGGMTWLGANELVSMGSTFVPNRPVAAGEPTSVPRQPPAPRPDAPAARPWEQYSQRTAPTAEAPSAQPPPRSAPMSLAQEEASRTQAYAEGRRDRNSWERWFDGLPPGSYRDGAFYWSGERSKSNPGNCESEPGDKTWTAGCSAARSMLAPFDVRRKTEPNYWWGWNSL